MAHSQCKVFLIYLFIVLVHALYNEDAEVKTISNTTKLMYEYFLLCGSDYFCHPDKVGFGSQSINTRHLKMCEDCKCDRDCTENGNCCADVIFTMPLPVCVTPSLEIGKSNKPLNNIYMINSCSNTTDGNLKRQCLATDIVFKTGHVEFPPVTSKLYRQTFKNKFCAECNGVFDYKDWSLSMDCPEDTDFNFFSTFDEILDKAETLDCSIGFSTVDNDIHDCNTDYVGVRWTSKCNKTGTWQTYDHDIDLACNSAYSVRNNSHSSQFFDVYIDSMKEDLFTRDGYWNDQLFVYSFSFKSYNLAFYNTILETSRMKTASKDVVIKATTRSVNISKLLLYDYSVTGYYRYCRENLVPYIVGEYECSCNPLCFFDGSLECCVDLVLEYPISCQKPMESTEGPSFYFVDGSAQNTSLDEYLPWSIHMQCESDMNIRFHTTIYDIIDIAKRSGCKVDVSSSEVNNDESCEQTLFKFPSPKQLFIEECNTTGYWREFDQDITWACKDSLLQNHYDLYRNVFCFICNPPPTKHTTKFIQNCTSDNHQHYGAQISRACREAPEVDSMFPAKNIFCDYCSINNSEIPLPSPIKFKTYFFMSVERYFSKEVSTPVLKDLFSPFAKKTKKDKADVNSSHIFDPITSRLRLLTCYPGKAIDGTECVPLLRTTTNLKYVMALSLEGTVHSVEQASTLLADTAKKVLSDMEEKLAIRELFVISFRIMSNVSCEIGNITSPLSFHLMIQTTFTIMEHVERLATEQLLLNITKDDFVISNATFSSRPAKEAYFLPSVPGSNFDGYCVKDIHYLSKYYTTLPFVRTTLVSDIMVCRQVALLPGEYSIKLETLELSVKYSSKKFHQDRYLRMPDGNVQLCLDDYLDIIDEYMVNSGYDTLREALSITTLICTVVSLSCLFLTFVTYLLFRTMRSVPGVNNMSLVFAMFFSQGFFQFGFERTTIPSLCVSIGVITHYFWLATFTSMNVCSYYMYSVFAINTLAGRSNNTRKQIALYLCYSYGAPLLVVTANIITSYILSTNDVSSGLTEIGYGGGACFISNSVSFYASFLAPIVLICASNMFMFVKVAIKIKKTPTVDSTKDHRFDFVIYLKLFTITGVTWIFVIIDTFFPLSVFSFIVTFLTGCQGLLIFFSFIWSKRVCTLYRKLLCKTKRNPTRSTTYSTRSVDTMASSM
ncbi:EGF-like module-containing mucin-like hormone receptor-like 1 [Mizuhopecten yessoensis]|uniref:EGF-like module-containing mucin-like hormone receptor-like 1 n=1 Tax=Mizuhopecten yessoensis TaxID=6573 RepID=A0A210QI76_MIZYE|nr:EGF-like module-containing mucin-like hormone receptor-like 1 [Mizuhopecten yessoensis]